MKFTLEIEQEEDGRWIAEILELPGVMAYGETGDKATKNAITLALRILADRIEDGEAIPSD